ncbi:hypothetical protein A3D00_05185 [Candidatus Woesebacteria bacterium RIFCSPHIGHO2_02_FULL_38_9]|uniref:Uncharacterized protein n=1 Tax=Candidatus Woesebacteria bacterium RIFCSPHIGHO2_01_FULL_39_28 TaxID=1802496 RepID=A0A1F7Y8X8_9BACT|nr:MAG: hypothetical protein A2627_05275 [Candidatus Woesebacteria bacterium RIFCSPHIGHO2_01_FULL_39_28]OGM34580.1 MAG: hypothetical protein A3D00_05185 [Candidatus Woesebacteria bacterium RIFCSPHIGHO2_02_FULL_38_9]
MKIECGQIVNPSDVDANSGGTNRVDPRLAGKGYGFDLFTSCPLKADLPIILVPKGLKVDDLIELSTRVAKDRILNNPPGYSCNRFGRPECPLNRNR